MKKFNSILVTACASMLAFNAFSQGPKVPAASPAASVKQTFGLTDITIDYSSPAVKGRQIWGALVPFDSVWRTGANAATVIDFSTNVRIGMTKVKKGKYALFTIPGKDTWTIIINSEWDQWASFNYHKSADVLRLMVKPEMKPENKERMAFFLDPATDSTCNVVLRWEKVKVAFEVKASTSTMVQMGYDNMMGSYANAANYFVDNKLDLNKAQQYAQMSIDIKESFYNNYIMATVQKAKGDIKKALGYAEKAKTMGEKADADFYGEFKDKIAKLITDCGGK